MALAKEMEVKSIAYTISIGISKEAFIIYVKNTIRERGNNLRCIQPVCEIEVLT